MIIYYILLAINICLSVLGQFLIKRGINGLQATTSTPSIMSYALNPQIIAGIFSYGIGMILWIMVLSKLKLSVAYPALSFGYVLVIIISWKFLGESLTPLKIVGAFLIIFGIALIFKFQ